MYLCCERKCLLCRWLLQGPAFPFRICWVLFSFMFSPPQSKLSELEIHVSLSQVTPLPKESGVRYLCSLLGGKRVCVCVCVCVLVVQSCPILWDPLDCHPPGSSVHGFFQKEYWSGLPFPSPGDFPNPGIEPGSPALQADSLPLSHQGMCVETSHFST